MFWRVAIRDVTTSRGELDTGGIKFPENKHRHDACGGQAIRSRRIIEQRVSPARRILRDGGQGQEDASDFGRGAAVDRVRGRACLVVAGAATAAGS